MQILSIDLETYSETDLKQAGAYKYAENSEILLFAYAFDDEPVEVLDFTAGEKLPARVRKALLDENILKVAFNAQFERTVISNYLTMKNMMDGDFTPVWLEPESWFCTMVQAYTLGLPGSLAEASKVLNLSEEKAKMSIGKQLIQYFCKPCKPTKTNGGRTRNLPKHAPEKWRLFKEYCRRDVEAERCIRKKMHKFQPNDFERHLWFLDQHINDRGVRIDILFVQNAIALDTRFKAETLDEAKKLTGLENPNSRAQILAWFEQQEGFLPEKFDKEARLELLRDNALTEKTKRLLKLKQLLSKTSVKKYEAMRLAACADKRGHGFLQFYGAARTGRWAGRLVQLHNLPRNSMNDLDFVRSLVAEGDFETLETLYDDVPDVLSQLIRTAFIAEEGSRFIVADFSAIEARVIAWLAGEKWRMDVFAANGDIYCSSASQMFHVPVEKHGVNGHLRQKGKIAELACGFGGGPGALIQMGALAGGLTEEELPEIIQKWRAASPNIVKLWRDVDSCAMQAVKKRGKVSYKNLQFVYESGILFIQLPSGRRLAYAKPRLEREKNFNRIGLTYEGTNQNTKQKGGGKWCRLRTYGGKLVENIVQAMARDCLAISMLRLDEAGYKIVMHVHDEVILEMPEGRGSLDEACKIMGRPIDWAEGLLLKAEGYETKYYKKD